jgi:SNF2 family DNA or RNA helicase
MISFETQCNLVKTKLNGQLYAPYQKEGVQWMLSMENQTDGPKGGFLCDEMGLGKTIQTISTILGNPQKNTLIIVPKSIVMQWKEEINKFAPSLSVFVYDGPDRTKNTRDLYDHDIVISTYNLLIEKTKILHGIIWGRVILDEAHEIRNAESVKFKSALQLKSEIRWLLTGTPVFNTMYDFINLCTFLGIPRFYSQGMTKNVKDTYILRRTKNDLKEFNANLELPTCYFNNVELEMFPEEKKLYKHVFLESQELIREILKTTRNINMRNMQFLECLLRARQVMIWPQMYLDGMAKKCEDVPEIWKGRSKKIETLLNMISEHPEEKAIVFCQFKSEMNHIRSKLTCPVFRIDGSVSKEDRIHQLQEFKRAPQNSVFLIQIKAGGQGLNIQCASRVYITAPSWNPATELQAIGRCHRTGQTRNVHVKKLVYVDEPEFPSVEESMMALQGHKSLISAEVLNDKRLETQIPTRNKTSGSISIAAIKNIFRV